MRKALVGMVVSGLVLFALVAAYRPRPVSSSPDIASSPIPPKKELAAAKLQPTGAPFATGCIPFLKPGVAVGLTNKAPAPSRNGGFAACRKPGGMDVSPASGYCGGKERI